MMLKLVLLRHGQSLWNLENRFTGWTDVDLSEQGIKEGHRAGKLLKAEEYVFDMAFTSVLKRAIRTLWIVLDDMDLMWIPVHRSWRLSERHYGALQGLNKRDMTAKYGLGQVRIWRVISHYYLGGQETIEKAQESVGRQIFETFESR